jgi:hypothetical protein
MPRTMALGQPEGVRGAGTPSAGAPRSPGGWRDSPGPLSQNGPGRHLQRVRSCAQLMVAGAQCPGEVVARMGQRTCSPVLRSAGLPSTGARWWEGSRLRYQLPTGART